MKVFFTNRINGGHINTTRSCKHFCCRSAPDTVDWADIRVIWRFRSSGRWGSVMGWVISDVSKERSALISKSKSAQEECNLYRDSNKVFLTWRLMMKFDYRKGKTLFTMMRRMALELIFWHPFCTGYKAAEEEPGSIFRVHKLKAAGVTEMLLS